MPKLMEKFLKEKITIINGYSDNFPELKFDNVKVLRKTQEKRLKLIREFTKRKDYLTKDGYIQSSLIYPSFNNSFESVEGYRKIVATQRYKYGKDYFENTPFTFKYYRDKENSFSHISGKPYKFGEIITDRPYDKSETILKGVGTVLTLIDKDGDNYDSEYLPLFKYPLIFEKKN